MPDFVLRQLAQYIGQAVGGPLWGTVAAEAAAISIAGAEFVNLTSRLRDGSATRLDVLAAVTATEAAMLGAGLVLTAGGVIAGVGAAIPLAVAVVATAAAAVWYERNSVAVSDALDVFSDSIERGDQPWQFLPKMWEAYKNEAYERRVSPNTNTTYRNALTPPRAVDPLAIDLDGDGIETVGIGTNPIVFDHNADGIRTGTGWVRGDDAWLALDRDGNGTIDTGRELFGVDTVLSGTPGVDAVYASNGFQALRTLDANADGIFNASDAAFSQVRLWQDLNQDGVSQTSELFTLAQRNIASIGLTPSTTTINLGNGNTITGQATVTRSNGSTTQIDSVSVGADNTAANLDLASNPFYREFTDTVTLTDTALALPEVGGSGVVRDLREAMSLGTAKGDAFAAQVSHSALATRSQWKMRKISGPSHKLKEYHA